MVRSQLICILISYISITNFVFCLVLLEDKQHFNLQQSIRHQLEENEDGRDNGLHEPNISDDRIMMSTIIDDTLKDNIESIYSDSDKYFLFHRICVMNVMFKTKWKKNRMIKSYYEYTDVSDEAFAFLLIENNGLRYIDMADEEKEEVEYNQPRYTDARRKNENGENRKNTIGRGWSQEGRMRFIKLQTIIENMRDGKQEMIENLGNEVLGKYRDMFGNKKDDVVEGSIEDIEVKDKRNREAKEWDDFIRMNSKRRRRGNQRARMPNFDTNADATCNASLSGESTTTYTTVQSTQL